MPTFYRFPSPARGEFNRKVGGIVEALNNHSRYLPDFGWQEVDDESTADLVVGHLGVATKRLDIFNLHGLYPTGDFEFSSGYWQSNAKIIENLRRARHVVAVSEWVAQILRRDMHMQPWVLGHGFDLEDWDSKSSGSFSNKQFALWNKTRDVGVCDPTPVLKLAQAFPNFQFVTTFLPRGQPRPSNVWLTGVLERSKAQDVVRDTAVYLATTKETFGIGTLEAMASGCAVVGFNWGNTPEVVGDAGLLVEPNDWEALSQAFQEALDRGTELGERARERVRTEFRWHDVVHRLADYYEVALCGLQPKHPKISVVIPAFNREQYVAHTIESVLAQTFQDWELVVVDDGSTDGTARVVTQSIESEPRARLVSQANRGVANARNAGIDQAQGEFICCLDSDDAIDPKFLATLVPALEADSKLGAVYTGITLMDSNDRLRPRVHSWPKPFHKNAGNQVPTCCLFRKSWWARLGGFRQRYAPRGAGQEDADFWFRILANGGGAEMVSQEGLFHYRVHGGQSTKTHRDSPENVYFAWHPFTRDGEHPIASQLAEPPKLSWPVRDYDRPEVSVIVPVGPSHVGCFVDAFDSVEAQTNRNWELIVVNDSGEPLNLTPWPFARLVETPGGKGAGYARNRGNEATKAPLFVYLDADDFLQPEFLSRTLARYHETGPGHWVYTDLYIIHNDGTLETYYTPDWNVQELWRSGVASVTCLHEQSAWEQVGGQDEELIGREDWDFHLRLAQAGFCGAHIKEPLFTYRHALGKRRLKGQRKREILVLHKRYSIEELELACRGCEKRRAQMAVNPPKSWQSKDALGWPVLEYTGRNSSDLLFKGPSKRRYRFGANKYHRTGRVHPSDVAHLLRLPYFRKVKASSVLTAPVPARPSVPAPRPRPRPEVSAPPIPPSPSPPKPEVSPSISEGPVPEAQEPEPEEDEPSLDISQVTLRELRMLDLSKFDLGELIIAERAGKHRKSVISFLQDRQRRRRKLASV